ncbi:MAG: hypothetical protein HY698_02635 [Deltaproteobacteria bacterium]|nr:hypothetical protein [Deltaproteobacteria bacterium]
MTQDSSMFRVEGTDVEGGKTLRLHGVVDEHADLSFFGQLKGRVQISLKSVRRINSYGVRAWIDAIRKVPSGVEFEFIECPPPVVDQMNMVTGFLGRGKVASFFAPLACGSCDIEQDHLFSVVDCRAKGNKLPSVKCPKCGGEMEVDDLEEQYLLFVRES